MGNCCSTSSTTKTIDISNHHHNHHRNPHHRRPAPEIDEGQNKPVSIADAAKYYIDELDGDDDVFSSNDDIDDRVDDEQQQQNRRRQTKCFVVPKKRTDSFVSSGQSLFKVVDITQTPPQPQPSQQLVHIVAVMNDLPLEDRPKSILRNSKISNFNTTEDDDDWQYAASVSSYSVSSRSQRSFSSSASMSTTSQRQRICRFDEAALLRLAMESSKFEVVCVDENDNADDDETNNGISALEASSSASYLSSVVSPAKSNERLNLWLDYALKTYEEKQVVFTTLSSEQIPIFAPPSLSSDCENKCDNDDDDDDGEGDKNKKSLELSRKNVRFNRLMLEAISNCAKDVLLCTENDDDLYDDNGSNEGNVSVDSYSSDKKVENSQQQQQQEQNDRTGKSLSRFLSSYASLSSVPLIVTANEVRRRELAGVSATTTETTTTSQSPSSKPSISAANTANTHLKTATNQSLMFFQLVIEPQ
eukprot:PhM_4_TR18832/c1_g1_i2/m.39793